MTEEFSILDFKKCSGMAETVSPFYLDLNLYQIIDYITAKWSKEVRSYYYYFPADEECETYRREVYNDVKKQGICETLEAFLQDYHRMEEARNNKGKVTGPLQKSMWQVQMVYEYCQTFENLHLGLEKQEVTSPGLKRFRELLGEYLGTPSYRKMSEDVKTILKELSEFRFVITYEKEMMVIKEGTVEAAYEKFLRKDESASIPVLPNPFQNAMGLTELESAVLDILVNKRPKLFKTISNKAAEYEEFTEKLCLDFAKEIPYYLSFWSFQRNMMEMGYAFCRPKVEGNREMEASGLYDLALACAASHEGREVVSNDLVYHEGESFFVLTGPNQGGKTTFARSLGQLVYFTKMGFDVPAREANVHYFRNILTHFSVEESVETGRGKLKEELIRLAPMMEESGGKQFVIINELFTTAATYDAEIMGRKVLEHFIGTNCRGIYVTHLKELATVHDSIVSLRAMLNEQRRQTFRIARSEAEESACAINQVNKYRLTYEQLKERL